MLAALLMAQVLACANPQDQMTMTMCAGAAASRADAAMNVQWKRTLAYMHKADADASAAPAHGPGYAEALLASQRTWLQFRDAECQIEGYAARGGSMQPMLVSDCLRQLTAQRTKQLAQLAKGET
ncbi:MAG: lysozyme inhibitor LprI family protein [Caulobacteraceae bacterium]